MANVGELLEPGERVVYSTRASWIKPLLASRRVSLLCLAGLVLVVLTPLLERLLSILTGHDVLASSELTVAASVLGFLVLGIGAMSLVQSFTDWWLQGCFVTNLRFLTVDQSSPIGNVPGTGPAHAVASRDGPVLTSSIWLDAVTDVTTTQDLAGVWFRFGTVRIEQGDSATELPLMRRPGELCEAITKQRAPFT
jgi:hypothetical protein